MRRSALKVGVLVGCAASMFGCYDILGLGDYKEGSAGGGGGAKATTSSSSQGGGGPTSSSTGSTTSTSTTASTSSTASSSSTGMAGVEDCLNGADDDNDQAIDCADTDCADHGCVDLPVGWDPVALGLGAMAPATCPQGYDVEVYHGFTDITFAPAMCSACQCLNPVAKCTPGQFGSASTTDCSFSIGFAQSGCTNLPVNNSTSFKGLFGTNSATCTPSGGVPGTLPTATWMTEGRACAANGLGAGCAGAECLALVPPSFDICVMHDGDIACPSGFTTRHLLTAEPTVFDDTRGCSPCECVGGSANCSFSTRIFATTNCTGTFTSISNNGTCIAGPSSNSSQPYITSFNPSCPPSGGQPTGEVKAGGAVATFCCP